MKKPDLENLRIISLTAENVKRLVAVKIRPNGRVVQITGKNGQGKTSVLDAVWWCLAGSRTIQAQPIRKGQQRAYITLDLGPIVVTRTFIRKGDTDYTTSVMVESQEGATFKSPQALIDSLLGTMSFDPLAFARMDTRAQYDTLRRFVPGIDFDLIDERNNADYNRRTNINRLVKEARAAASIISVPENTPAEEIDKTALVEKLEDAHRKNREADERRSNQAKAREWMETARVEVANLEANITQATTASEQIRDATIASYEAQIAQLQKAIEHSKRVCQETIERESASLRRQAADLQKRIEDTQSRLEQAAPIPDPIDTEAIVKEINAADAVNRNVARAAERQKHLQIADQYEAEARELTEAIKARTAAKEAAIAAAELPVPGLGFDNGCITLNGLPFDQASDAERLTASVVIAIKANPVLRVIRIRDGSLLDEDAMKLLDELAAKYDMQIWVERVDGSGTVGFVLEDGHVRNAEVEEGATA